MRRIAPDETAARAILRLAARGRSSAHPMNSRRSRDWEVGRPVVISTGYFLPHVAILERTPAVFRSVPKPRVARPAVT